MTTVTIEEAQIHLKDIIAGLAPGEELVIVQGGRPVAALVAPQTTGNGECKAGGYRKEGFLMSSDFDAPLELTESEAQA